VVQCPDGTICAAGSTCGVAPNRCISAAQATACNGKAEGDACVLSGNVGECSAGTCLPRFCGDGIKSAAEECDGDDLGAATCASEGFYVTTTGVVCNSDCTLDVSGCTGACGDSVKNGTELCDHGDLGSATCIDAGFYSPGGLACSAFCTYDVQSCQGRCQDGIKNGPELCDGTAPPETCHDLGLDGGLVGCSTSCGYEFSQCARFGFRVEPTQQIVHCEHIHASSASDIWVTSGPDASHFDGASWESVSPPILEPWRSLWVIAPGDAWIISDGATVMHWNGTSWIENTTAPAGAIEVWAAASDDVWVMADANNESSVYRWNGSTWTEVAGLGISKPVAIHGSDANNVWALGGDGEVARWNGTLWLHGIIDPRSVAMHDIVVHSSDDVWVGGYLNDDSETLIAHFTGVQWNVTTRAGDGISQFQSAGPDSIWAIGKTTLYFDGVSWLDIGETAPCVLGFAAGAAVQIRDGDVTRLHGQFYATADPGRELPSLESPWRMWSEATGELFVSLISAGFVAQYDGSHWTRVQASTGLVRAFWGFGANDVWAIGSSGKPAHWDGSDWQDSVVANTKLMFTMYASGPNDLWAGGADGTVLRYDGATWTASAIPSTVGDRIVQLSGTGPNDVWAFMFSNKVYRYTGTWAQVTFPNGFAPSIVQVIAPDHAIAIDRPARTAQYWNGSTWTPGPFPAILSLPEKLGAAAADDVFAMAGTDLMHYEGTKWSRIRVPVEVTGVLRDIAVRPERIDMLFSTGELRTLVRPRPWVCKATEVGACSDHVDNDCDGLTDALDTDCP
jgi:hypothetical protein